MSHDWPVNTDFKLDYNHKLHKKLPNQTPTYVLVTLWDLNTILCTISRVLYTGVVQSVYDAGYSHLKGAERNAPGASPF